MLWRRGLTISPPTSSAKTLEDLCDALPLCASLWSTCGITVAPQFELILYAMRAKYLDGQGTLVA